jgi:CBS domain-containing protein
MIPAATNRKSSDTRIVAPVVAEVMHTGVVFCSRGASVPEIAGIMARDRMHCVAVLGHAQGDPSEAEVWGIVSDLDLLAALLDDGVPATAGTLARTPVIRIASDRPVTDAARAMATHRTSHLIVTDPDQHTPIGVISSLDVAARLAETDA